MAIDADLELARAFADAVGAERLIAAVDARGGRVAIHGWRTVLRLTPVDAVRALEPFVGEFLYHQRRYRRTDAGNGSTGDRGRPRGHDSRASPRPAASPTEEEIAWLDGIGVDAVVGMAVYTGRLAISPPPSG